MVTLLPVALCLAHLFLTVSGEDSSYGLTYQGGRSCAPIQLEVFVSMQCPDSQEAFPTLLNVAEHYGPDKLRLVIAQFPLPWHRHAFILGQVAYALSTVCDVDSAFTYMSAIFEKLSNFSNSATFQMTTSEILEKACDVAIEESMYQINKTELMGKVADAKSETKRDWKAGLKKSASGAPFYYINGKPIAEIQGTGDRTFDQWKDYIDPILAAAEGKKSEPSVGSTAHMSGINLVTLIIMIICALLNIHSFK